MKPVFKRWGIWAVLGAGIVLATLEFPEKNRPQAAPRAFDAAASQKSADLVDVLRRAPLSPKRDGQPFATLDWTPARPVARAPAAEAPVPQFPFRFAGHLKAHGGATSLYLARGDDIFPIRVGDVLAGFRIDALQDDRLDLTYVSGGQHFSMPLSRQ
jgi:hypothetical protein